jgi:hypothetical protein
VNLRITTLRYASLRIVRRMQKAGVRGSGPSCASPSWRAQVSLISPKDRSGSRPQTAPLPAGEQPAATVYSCGNSNRESCRPCVSNLVAMLATEIGHLVLLIDWRDD